MAPSWALLFVGMPCLLPLGAAQEGQCKAGDEGCGIAGSCGAGVFVGLTKQPDLGLRHFPVTTESLPIARLVRGECALDYYVKCVTGRVLVVTEVPRCAGGAGLHGPAVGPLNGTWEVCAQSQMNLKLLAPVIDLTFDNELPAGTAAVGCVRLTLPSELPMLAAVRGPPPAQIKALQARKLEVGGCPHWTSPDEPYQRGWDFAAVGSYALGAAAMRYQSWLVRQAEELRTRGPPSEDLRESIEGFAVLGSMIALNDMKNTESYLVFTKANCGVSVPLGVGAMASARWSVVAAEAANPKQPRSYFCPWGSACSEVCWDRTLPIFLSSGTPEHTQVRRLWDEVGMRTMAEADFLEEDPVETSWVQTLRNAVGFNIPTEGDVAALVSPLLIERLFRKKPTEQQAAFFAEYATYGKLCIKSALLAWVPLVSSRVRSIRAAVTRFGMDSPVGRELSKKLDEPQYTELKKQLLSRGKPLLEMAMQNMADASMFAGMVGTTDMTWKCVKYLYRDPAHVRMFRNNPTNYLWELMRLQPAVQGFTTSTTKASTVIMFGKEVHLPAGTPLKYASSMANRDPAVFSDPTKFDPDRKDWGENMAWNGQLKHVVSHNYTGAPRHCPGHDLSVKIAVHVCERLTRHLEAAS